MKKCVFVIGTESSGSMLVAKICSHVLNIQKYGEWGGGEWSDKGNHKVLHRSLPYGKSIFPDVNKWIKDNLETYEIYFILTTRDITISEHSRKDRWNKSLQQSKNESKIAKDILSDVINNSKQKFFIWSYETFMFLEKEYLKLLYEYIGVSSDFIPPLYDGNLKRLLSWNLP